MGSITRRHFLFSVVTLAGGVLLPSPVMARTLTPAHLDSLHEQARNLAQRSHGEPPLVILREATDYLRDVEEFLPLTLGRHRVSLHRTAGLTALVGACCARWMSKRLLTTTLLERADGHARAAGDGTLRAQVLLLRSELEGESAYATDAGHLPSQRLLAAALAVAGPVPLLRSLIRYELAWDLAAVGDARGALMELEAADFEHDRATPAPDVVEFADGVWKLRRWAQGYRGSVLRRLGHHEDAIAASSEALVGPPQWQTYVLVDVARNHSSLGNVDAAAAALREAASQNALAGLAQRQGRVRSARALLPDEVPAVRELDEVLDG